jgi:hypothetical protein
MRGILALTPLDLVDLLLNLERFEIVKFWLVRLKFGVEFVLATLFLQGDASDIGGLTMTRTSMLHRHPHVPSHFARTVQHDHPCHQWQGSYRSNRIQRSR